MKKSKLVFSTDPEKNKRCPKCNELIPECKCKDEKEPKKLDFTAVLRIEKSGRKGKTVTVIDGLPKNENFLKTLAKKLKKQCGSGGTYKIENNTGIIEIQGDERVQIHSILDKEGIKNKG